MDTGKEAFLTAFKEASAAAAEALKKALATVIEELKKELTAKAEEASKSATDGLDKLKEILGGIPKKVMDVIHELLMKHESVVLIHDWKLSLGK